MLDAVTMWVAGAVLLQVALTLALLGYLGFVRVPLIMGGTVPIRDIALSREAWPDREKQVSNAVDNQFQLPVLFYLGAAFVLATSALWFDAILAWAFVLSRCIHVFIHVTDNNVVRRFWAYTAGYVILCVFWLTIALRFVAIIVALGLR